MPGTHSILASLVLVTLRATFPAVQILLGAYCMVGGACDRQHKESILLKIIVLHVQRERIHPASFQRNGDGV